MGDGAPGSKAGMREDGRVTIVAEIGVNHNGLPGLAHQLVDAAADAGADAVKFQTFVPELVVAASAPTAPYQSERGSARTQLELVGHMALDRATWTELSEHAHERGVTFLSTAFDEPSVDVLEELGVPMLKVPSGEIDNLGFIEHLAGRAHHLVISTGTADLGEVEAALTAARAAPAITLLHCVSAYPAPLDVANLRAITTMQERFGVDIGWSDHTTGPLSATLAVALGATMIEKHVTLDSGLPGPDHAASAAPSEFAAYVTAIRNAERALGHGRKEPHPMEEPVRAVARRSWHTTREIAAGTALEDGDVVALRPATGIAPSVAVVGRRTRHALEAGQAIHEQDLEA